MAATRAKLGSIIDTACLAGLFAIGIAAVLTVDSAAARFHRALDGSFFNYFFLAWLAGGVALEWVLPARPEERSDVRGLVADLIWTGVKLFAFVVFLIPVSGLVGAWLAQAFDAIGIRNTVATGSQALNALLALLMVEFLFYWSHRLRHRIRFFWRFHAVHHSQERLNILTCHRTHPFDDLFHLMLIAVPAALFAVSAPWMAVILLIVTGYTRFYHANLRLSLGPLRHVLVSPQFHRIHHSRLPEHADRNFGLLLSFWDRLFGTYVCPEGAYPETGVADFAPALERQAEGYRHLPATVWRQLTLQPARPAIAKLTEPR